ncbi:MAG: hypothetical protein K6G25_06565 [Bacteroidales bacterium]|nr:hypothetical protein [Bacteroidales bacterium]
MKSTLGRRASICKELGWSLEFVEHGISYAKLQMMMIDMPRIIHTDGKKVEHITLTDENAESVWSMMMARTKR